MSIANPDANPDAVRGIGIGMQESWSAIVMLLAHGITLGPIYGSC